MKHLLTVQKLLCEGGRYYISVYTVFALTFFGQGKKNYFFTAKMNILFDILCSLAGLL